MDSVVAIYAALVGTAAFGWNIFIYLSRRGRLRFSWGIGHRPQPDEVGSYLVGSVYLANVGERTMRLVAFKGLQADGDFFYVPCVPDNALDPLAPHDYVNIDLSAELLANADFVGLSAVDSSLREHKMPTGMFDAMRNAVLEERKRLKDLEMYEARRPG